MKVPKMTEDKRNIVIPSELLGDANKFKAGKGTFIEDGKIYSEKLGILSKQSNYINIIPIKGKYDPVQGDFIIGIVEEPLSSSWLVDINAPYPALLHINEVPWDVDFGETEKYLNKGDAVLAKILEVSTEKKLQITLKDRNLYKIKGGYLTYIEPSKVPRLIGKKGSMISLLKKYSNSRIFIGKNGRIWIDGKDENIAKIINAINIIENESISYGLTDKIEKLLKENSQVVR
jgi:exosome complex component RRP4